METALEMVDRVNSIWSSVEINEQQCKRLAQVYEEIGRHLYKNGKNSSNLNIEPLLKVMEAGEHLISQCAGPDWFQIALVKADNKEAFEELHLDLHVWFRTIFSTELMTSEFDPITDASDDIKAMLKKLQRKDSSGTPLEGQHPWGMIPRSSLTLALYKVQNRAQFLESLNHHNFEAPPLAPVRLALKPQGYTLEEQAAELVKSEELYSPWKQEIISYGAYQSDPLGARNRLVSHRKRRRRKEEKKEERKEGKKEERKEEKKEELKEEKKKERKEEKKEVSSLRKEEKLEVSSLRKQEKYDPNDYPSDLRPVESNQRYSNPEPSYYPSNYLYSRIPDREWKSPEFSIPMSEIAVREEALIGEGSTAQVKKADWLGMPCAVKIFPNYEGARLIRNEVEIHRTLKNTYVVTLIGLAVEGNRNMMVMELMDFNLHDLIVKQSRWFPNWMSKQVHKAGFPSRTPFRLHVAVGLMLQIAKGMDYLHDEHKLLHGDLKTENILGLHIGTDNYKLKIADFGISQKLSSEMPTVSGKHMGSNFFRAPEVLHGSEQFSFEADVYSFAMISYEILTGLRPFEELSDVPFAKLRREVIGGRRPCLPWSLHKSVRDLVQLCWHDDRPTRPTFFQIRLELERLHKSFATAPPRSRWCWEGVLFLLSTLLRGLLHGLLLFLLSAVLLGFLHGLLIGHN